MYRTGDVSNGRDTISGTGFQATPLMVDRTLYFPTPFGRVIALDAETGAERWTFDPGIDRSISAQRFMTSRGVATSGAECGPRPGFGSTIQLSTESPQERSARCFGRQAGTPPVASQFALLISSNAPGAMIQVGLVTS